MQIPDPILADAAAMTAIRRDLHAHPEAAFDERRTADIVAAALAERGIEIHRGLGRTGLVGVVRKGTGPRTVGLRADMDALPMTEQNRFAHASRQPGRMHACGHDGHVAMLLAAGRHLATHSRFDGTVYLIFQPAEEGGGGAPAMIADGLFERFPMEAIFGMHNWPGLAVGQFAIGDGPCLASTSGFRVTVTGRGAHAAFPHLGIDPVPVACQIVQAFQTIVTRNVNPTAAALISVTMIHAGEVNNVIADRCVFEGTVRTFLPEVLDLIERRMRQVAESTCTAFEADCSFEFRRQYPATINHAAEAAFVRGVMSEIAGPENVLPMTPVMGAEDFSYFLLQRPGAYFEIGNGCGEHRAPDHGPGPSQLHNGSYDFNDALIPVGAALWVGIAERWLARPRR